MGMLRGVAFVAIVIGGISYLAGGSPQSAGSSASASDTISSAPQFVGHVTPPTARQPNGLPVFKSAAQFDAQVAMDVAFSDAPYQAYLAEKQVECGATAPWVATRMESVVGLKQVQLERHYGLTHQQFVQEADEESAFAKKEIIAMSCSFADASVAAIRLDALRLGGP